MNGLQDPAGVARDRKFGLRRCVPETNVCDQTRVAGHVPERQPFMAGAAPRCGRSAISGRRSAFSGRSNQRSAGSEVPPFAAGASCRKYAGLRPQTQVLRLLLGKPRSSLRISPAGYALKTAQDGAPALLLFVINDS